MRIISLEIENIKSYQTERVDFTDGFNAIVGLNGAGKSTLLEAIGFALFDSLDYTLTAFLRRGSNGGAISIVFESSLDGMRYRVVRKIGVGNMQSVYEAETNLRICVGSADVTTFLLQHMGLGPAVDRAQFFRDAVGVPQGTQTAAFHAIPSRRKAIFDPLLHAEEYKQAFDNLLEPKNRLAERANDVGLQLKWLEGVLQQLPELESRAAEVATQLTETSSELARGRETLATLGAQRLQLEAENASVLTAQAALDQCRRESDSTRAALEVARQFLQVAEEAQRVVAEHRAGHDRYESAVVHKRALDAQAAQRQRLELQRERALGDLRTAEQGLAAAQEALRGLEDAALRSSDLLPLVDRQDALTARRDALRLQVAHHGAAQRMAEHAEKLLTEKRRALERLRELAASRPGLEAQLSAARAERTRLHDRQEEVADHLGAVRSDGERLNQLIDRVSQAEGATLCPVCQQPLGPDHVRELRSRYESERNDCRTRWTRLSGELQEVRRLLDEQDSAAKAAELGLMQTPDESVLREAEGEVNSLDKEAEQARERMAELGVSAAQLAACEAEVADLGNPRALYDSLQVELARRVALETASARAMEQVADQQLKVQNLDEEVRAFADLDAQATTLSEAMAADLPSYQLVLGHAGIAAQLPQRSVELQSASQAYETAAAARTVAEDELSARQAEFDPLAYARILDQYGKAQGAIGSLEARVEILSGERSSLAEKLAGLEEQQKRHAALQVNAKELRLLAQDLDKMRNVIKQSGPKVTEALVQQISDRAGQFFGELTSDYTRRLRWTENYGITLEVDGHTLEFGSLSGGEQMVAALAVRLALLRETSSIDLAFFDEPTANLDEQRRDALARHIASIKGLGQLFVITHDDSFGQYIDHNIRIERVDGASRIVRQ